MRIIVLGAGLAGLSTAYTLSKNGHQVTVLEKQPVVGGLAKSIQFDGSTCDLGPHRFHSKEEDLIQNIGTLIGDKWSKRKRKSRIYLEGKYFDYPLKPMNAVFSMPPITAAKIMADYAVTTAKNKLAPSPDDSFETWVVNRFGRKLYDIYFGPYTEKVWGLHPTKISRDWASQRITLMNLFDVVLKTIFKPKDEPRTLVSEFYYPNEGGIGTIANEIAGQIKKKKGKIVTSAQISTINIESGKVKSITYNAGKANKTEECDFVVSTIPLTGAAKLIQPTAPQNVLASANSLTFRALVFVYLLLDKERITDDNWIYFPMKDIIFNRTSEPKNFQEKNVPHGKTVVCAEITCNDGDEVWNAQDSWLVEKTTKDFENLGLFKASDVLGSHIEREQFGYPVYDLNYEQNLNNILGFLHSLPNFLSIGRNGLFRYDNMDHSIKMGLLAAEDITKENRKSIGVATEQNYFG